MLHSAQAIRALAAALCICVVSTSPALAEDAPVVSEPLLRFDIIEVPGEGRVSTVTGNVERLSGDDRWVSVKPRYRVLHGDKLKVSAGATLTIKFAGKERAEFTAAPIVRWLRFEVSGRLGHDP